MSNSTGGGVKRRTGFETGTLLVDRFVVESILRGDRLQEAVADSGATIRVRDQSTGEACILKALLLRGASSWKAVELFEREAAVLKRLRHPRVPRFVADFRVEPEDERGAVTFWFVGISSCETRRAI